MVAGTSVLTTIPTSLILLDGIGVIGDGPTNNFRLLAVTPNTPLAGARCRMSTLTAIPGLFLYYLFIANNYTDNLISGQLQDFLRTNRIAKHIIGFMFGL